MNRRRLVFFLILEMSWATIAFTQGTPASSAGVSSSEVPRSAELMYGTPRLLAPRAKTNPLQRTSAPLGTSGPQRPLDISTEFSDGSNGLFPVWTYNIRSSRDGDLYPGSIIGHDPFANPGTTRIPTYIIPLVVRTHRIATSLDPTTLIWTTAPGDITVDPTAPDYSCLERPNNVPVTVVRQSPIFTPSKFVFGGTDVGTTQYLDAHMRASFWDVLGEHKQDYHVLLDPIQIADPVVIDVPSEEGLAIDDPQILAQYGFTICTPIQEINIGWLETYLNGTVIPLMSKRGVTAGTLPIYLVYNAFFPVFDVTEFYGPVALGYHNISGNPLLTGTYAVVDFDRSNLFVGPPTGLDTDVLAHEIGEWGNDPYIFNATPPWGGTGQDVGFCQSNLEVGDPLSGTDLPPVIMPNGHAYSLQELAFFSWFYGSHSIAANGWYSNGGTFLTDAGPLCPQD